MKEAKETVEKIIKQIEIGSHLSKENLIAQLRNILKRVTQNETKIWLRTRSGKPMAEKLKEAALETLNQVGNASRIEEAIKTLEDIAKEIDDESQRRSMVVT
jgi:hypothetical protein